MIEDFKNVWFKFKVFFRLVDIIDEKIEDNVEEMLEYVVLSYIWGDIILDGKKF